MKGAENGPLVRTLTIVAGSCPAKDWDCHPLGHVRGFASAGGALSGIVKRQRVCVGVENACGRMSRFRNNSICVVEDMLRDPPRRQPLRRRGERPALLPFPCALRCFLGPRTAVTVGAQPLGARRGRRLPVAVWCLEQRRLTKYVQK